MADITLNEVKTAIQAILVSSLTQLGEDGDFSNDLIGVMIDSLFDEYKSIRNYPDSVEDETIDAETAKYFNRKKSFFGTQVVPALLTKAGAEGLETLIDNQVSKYWGKSFENYFPDVVPYCGVI